MLKTFVIFIFLSSLVYSGDSAFGTVPKSLGNLSTPFSAAGMGRSYETAHLDSVQLNFVNPAAWSDISRTSLSFKFNYNAIWSENNISKSFFDDANFKGAYLAVPLLPKELVFGVGIQPYTNMVYQTFGTVTQDSFEVKESAFFSGGLSKANFNLIYKINPTYAVGLGYEFTFGRISEETVLDVSGDVATRVPLVFERQIFANGLVLSAVASPVENLTLGLVIKPSLNGTVSYVNDTPSDNINLAYDEDISLPTELNFGAEYLATNNYLIGMDFAYQDWGAYKIDGAKIDQHQPYFYLGSGIEWKASDRLFVKYSDQIDWRVGGYYKQLAHKQNNKSVSEYGLTAGLSLPVIRFRSKLDISAFVARRGTVADNGLQETVMGIGFSVSANELWFKNLED